MTPLYLRRVCVRGNPSRIAVVNPLKSWTYEENFGYQLGSKHVRTEV
jgi:hypothetical protein